MKQKTFKNHGNLLSIVFSGKAFSNQLLSSDLTGETPRAYAKTIAPSEKIGERKAAFTLAEVLMVLVILGIVASLTVTTVIQKHIKTSKRTRIKKAVTVYDSAINKMVVENSLKSDDALLNWADNDCTNTSAYFKIVEKVDGSNCTFKAPDGLYWDISDIENPIVAQTKDDLTNHKADPTSAGTNAFTLSAWFDDNGSLRVDDLAAADESTKPELTRLYNYINNKAIDDAQQSGPLWNKLTNNLPACESQEYKSGGINNQFGDSRQVCLNCSGCVDEFTYNSSTRVKLPSGRTSLITVPTDTKVVHNLNGDIVATVECREDVQKCYYQFIELTDKRAIKFFKSLCNENGEDCESETNYEILYENDEKNITIERDAVDNLSGKPLGNVINMQTAGFPAYAMQQISGCNDKLEECTFCNSDCSAFSYTGEDGKTYYNANTMLEQLKQ